MTTQNAKIEQTQMSKSKCPACRALAGRLNAKTTPFCPLGFGLDLTLFRI